MGTKINEEDRSLYKGIDEILYFDWNPIGVSNLPRDEYKSYVPSIFNLKKAGADIETITNTLMMHEIHIVGIAGDINKCRLIAKMIQNLQ